MAVLGSFKGAIKRVLRKVGLEVEYVGVRRSGRGSGVVGEASAPYRENAEVGPVNLSEKKARQAEGEPFEWPNIVALNQAVAGLVGADRRIVELAGGTGCFAVEASKNPERVIVCSELDSAASRWAAENRPRPNVRYIDRMPTSEDGPFDLVVAVELIEHVEDYVGLLRQCTMLAPRAIITTPNRQRGPKFDVAGPPPVAKHVREWTAGEFYWVLRSFYGDVRLYAMPNPYVPEVVPIQVTDRLTPLIADCRKPILRGA